MTLRNPVRHRDDPSFDTVHSVSLPLSPSPEPNHKTYKTEKIMKTSAVKLLCAIVVGAMTLAAPATFAGTINKAATGTDLAAGASWTGGTAPGSGDVATWASGSLGGALTMSTGPTWGGIALTTATADPTIAAPGSGAFTLGSSGIDLSSTANNMTINAPITLGASQIWNVNVGKTLTAGGLISGLQKTALARWS